jgi:hypothetical protein
MVWPGVAALRNPADAEIEPHKERHAEKEDRPTVRMLGTNHRAIVPLERCEFEVAADLGFIAMIGVVEWRPPF